MEELQAFLNNRTIGVREGKFLWFEFDYWGELFSEIPLEDDEVKQYLELMHNLYSSSLKEV